MFTHLPQYFFGPTHFPDVRAHRIPKQPRTTHSSRTSSTSQSLRPEAPRTYTFMRLIVLVADGFWVQSDFSQHGLVCVCVSMWFFSLVGRPSVRLLNIKTVSFVWCAVFCVWWFLNSSNSCRTNTLSLRADERLQMWVRLQWAGYIVQRNKANIC